MPYQAPSLADVSKQLRAAIRAQLPGSEPGLWPNNLAVLAKSMAPMFRGLYQRIEQVRGQARVPTADTEGLEIAGAEIGITRKPAQVASGTATAVTVIGTLIPDGTQLARIDGVLFSTLGDVTATGTSTTLQVRAADAGAAGNTVADIALTPVSPISGLGAITIDDAGLGGGANIENDASLRSRILARKRNPPQAGAPSDYVEWAQRIATTTRAFVQRATPSPGSVTVYFMMDDSYSDSLPRSGDVAALQALLNTLAPADADVIVAAPTLSAVNVTITGLTPDTPSNRAAVAEELAQMFVRRAVPGGEGGSPFVFPRAWLAEAISMAAPSLSYTLTLPAVDVSCGTGVIAALGTLTFA